MKKDKDLIESRQDIMLCGFYHVEVFGEDGNKVDERHDVIACTRREAYFDVMNDLKPHSTWDATRVKKYVA